MNTEIEIYNTGVMIPIYKCLYVWRQTIMYVCQILGSAALLLQGSVKLPCRRILVSCRIGCPGVQAKRGTSADAAIAYHAAQTG